ncbi:hypothetical protein J2Y45_002652 [Dyadobacter sp. BE34]|uniref:Uncharacterized protein n=1 Tax=Dyadobacter fermentans TaxID=94254 RepID=A0ABU1QWD8_9BACT|nr:hypothetical protein [Dyadobacter fermentans]MDR7043201.1 hypothetical protein [Dyadobacter sp. BE242]MDR7197513.1 hypothetical protein [Dyadobacter sp. BE34]MDR7215054.1 hypothetical protein [Dyadobacter sp. BE31]MDR7262589.1 hypothetical protein [Dyadobacter sp. BE32]
MHQGHTGISIEHLTEAGASPTTRAQDSFLFKKNSKLLH